MKLGALYSLDCTVRDPQSSEAASSHRGGEADSEAQRMQSPGRYGCGDIGHETNDGGATELSSRSIVTLVSICSQLMHGDPT